MIRYVTIDFKLDFLQLAIDVIKFRNEVVNDPEIPIWTYYEFDTEWLEVSGGYTSSLEYWANRSSTDEQMISMKRFLLLCNKCDLNPLHYFVLDE